jgi:hypothetical protein
VSIGTDAFVQSFVAKTCRTIIDDTVTWENWTLFKTALYIIRSSGFGRPLDSNILILIFSSVIVTSLQQQHVDCKITDALLKRGTKQHSDGCDTFSKAWSHMVLHLEHSKDGFGVTFNDITKDVVVYTSTSRFVS